MSEETILKLSGRVHGFRDDEFKNLMEKTCDKCVKKVILDVSDLTYIDSYGVGIVLSFYKALEKQGRKLILFNDGGKYMEELFKITGIDKVFTVISSVDQLKNS